MVIWQEIFQENLRETGGVFPRYEISFSQFFAKVFFAKKSQEFPLWSEIDTAHANPIGGGGAKEQKRHYVIIVRETAAGSLGEGKKKAYFRAFDQSDGAWRSHCQIYHRRSIRQKKSTDENNNSNNNISIHSFDLGKSKRDFPGRNSVLRNSVARTISKTISKISTVPHLFHI